MKNANGLLDGAAKAEAGTPVWAELKRRPGFEVDGMVLRGYEQGHPAGFSPVVVLDVFEHAFMVDRGASGRDAYIEAFLENVSWEVVEQRHKDSKAGRFTARF